MSPFAFWNCLEDRISPFGIVPEYLRPSSAREKHLLIHLGWTLRDWAFTLGCPSELVLSRPSRQDVNPNGCGLWAGKVSLRWNFTVGSTNSFALAILLPQFLFYNISSCKASNSFVLYIASPSFVLITPPGDSSYRFGYIASSHI